MLATDDVSSQFDYQNLLPKSFLMTDPLISAALSAAQLPTIHDMLFYDLPLFSKDGVVNPSDVQTGIDVKRAMGAIKPDQQFEGQALYTNEFVNRVK